MGLGNLMGMAGLGSNASKSIAGLPAGTFNNKQVVRKIDVARDQRRFGNQAIKQALQKGGTPNATTITTYQKDTVLANGQVAKKGSKTVNKGKLSKEDFMEALMKKYVGHTHGEISRMIEKEHGINMKGESGQMVQIRLDQRGRNKVAQMVTGGGGPTLQQIKMAKQLEKMRTRRNVLETVIGREKEEKLAEKIQEGRQKRTKEDRERERVNRAVQSTTAEGYKASMSDLNIINKQAEESRIGVNVDRAQGQGAVVSAETGEGAASVAASIGANAEALKTQKAESAAGRELPDHFDRVAQMGKVGIKKEASESFFKEKAEKAQLPDEAADGEADDRHWREAA